MVTEIDSAAVRHRGNFSEQTGVHGQGAAVMRGVLDHGPYDVTDRLTTHDRAGRQRPGEILRAARADEVDGVGVCRFEYLASGGEGGHTRKSLGVFLEIEIETFASGSAFDEPIESLGRVSDLLRDGHHAFPRTEFGVGLIEDPG